MMQNDVFLNPGNDFTIRGIVMQQSIYRRGEFLLVRC
jgi:hypothetical protein